MDFGLAFSYVFKDKDWFKKLTIAGLVALIPIIGTMILYGWMMKITRKVMDHDLNSLPEIEFGDDLSRGFMGAVISLVYSLPMILVYGVILIFSLAGSYAGYEQTTDPLTAIISLCGGLFMMVYGLFIAYVMPAAFGKYLENNSLSDAFNFSEVFKMLSRNPTAYLIVLLGTIVVGLIAPLGLIACIIGVLWTATYGMAVQGHLYGQAYNEANREKLIVEIPPASS